jgi:hypothetical protein
MLGVAYPTLSLVRHFAALADQDARNFSALVRST